MSGVRKFSNPTEFASYASSEWPNCSLQGAGVNELPIALVPTEYSQAEMQSAMSAMTDVLRGAIEASLFQTVNGANFTQQEAVGFVGNVITNCSYLFGKGDGQHSIRRPREKVSDGPIIDVYTPETDRAFQLANFGRLKLRGAQADDPLETLLQRVVAEGIEAELKDPLRIISSERVKLADTVDEVLGECEKSGMDIEDEGGLVLEERCVSSPITQYADQAPLGSKDRLAATFMHSDPSLITIHAGSNFPNSLFAIPDLAPSQPRPPVRPFEVIIPEGHVLIHSGGRTSFGGRKVGGLRHGVDTNAVLTEFIAEREKVIAGRVREGDWRVDRFRHVVLVKDREDVLKAAGN